MVVPLGLECSSRWGRDNMQTKPGAGRSGLVWNDRSCFVVTCRRLGPPRKGLGRLSPASSSIVPIRVMLRAFRMLSGGEATPPAHLAVSRPLFV